MGLRPIRASVLRAPSLYGVRGDATHRPGVGRVEHRCELGALGLHPLSPLFRYHAHMDHDERQAAMERYRAEGKSEAWIAGWWRSQMRHPANQRHDAPDQPDPESTP